MLGAAPLLTSAGSEACVNPNILAYYTPETMASQDKIIFYIPSFVPISTLEASINGKSHAVQYKKFGFLTRAKVIIPGNLSGKIRASIGAQSRTSSCNKTVDFSFRR